METGANTGLASIAIDFNATTDTITVEPAFPNAIAAGDEYTIIPRQAFPALNVALNATGLSVTTNSLVDQLYIAAGEQLRNFIAKTGGTVLSASKSLVNALGNSGDTPIPAADNTTAAGSSSIQATYGRKDDTSLGLSAAASAVDTAFRYQKASFDRTRMPSAADNSVAASEIFEIMKPLSAKNADALLIAVKTLAKTLREEKPTLTLKAAETGRYHIPKKKKR